MEFIHGRSFRDIFRNGAEARSGAAGAGGQIRLTGELVREAIARNHFMNMGAGGRGEICVPLERRNFFVGAFVVVGVEEKFFVGANILLGRLLRKTSRRKNQKCKREHRKNRPRISWLSGPARI